jgi:hypothetical protein
VPLYCTPPDLGIGVSPTGYQTLGGVGMTRVAGSGGAPFVPSRLRRAAWCWLEKAMCRGPTSDVDTRDQEPGLWGNGPCAY